MQKGGFYLGTRHDEEIIKFWTQCPDANVGIACGFSDLYVVDVDHGLTCEADFIAWRDRNKLPVTYTVRTGRRTEFAVQMYFQGAIECTDPWELDGCRGEIRSAGALVMAVGNIHPDTGEEYTLLIDAPTAPRPAIFDQPGVVKPKKAEKKTAADSPTLPLLGKGDGRHPLMMQKLGACHRAGLSEEEAIAALIALSDTRFSDPIALSEIERTVQSCYAKWDPPEVPPAVVLPGKAPDASPEAWAAHYHTRDDMENTPPPEFLIDGFLLLESITAIAAPVGQRKSLFALNVAHALCTKKPLFGYFAVTKQPTRVLYLCPEMGLRSFTGRLRRIGLMPYVGDTLFCRTMSASGLLELDQLQPEELAGAVLIIDTAVRYLKGDENSSEHMRAFAEIIFRIMKDGAAAVLLLHHSRKGTKESSELTLENAMRGSGELGAFVASCWATRLQDPSDSHNCRSYLSNVKQRDFESKPFEVENAPAKDCSFVIVAEPSTNVVLSHKSTARPGDEGARAWLQAHPELSIRKAADGLKAAGYKRGPTWVKDRRYEWMQGTKPKAIRRARRARGGK
jgi:hypothetical protein